MAAENDRNPYFRKIDNRSRWEKLSTALWNSEEKTLLGRNAKGWGLLLLFYTIFYAVLAALFAICMYAMLNTLPEEKPMFILDESLIGINPGMGFRPQFVEEGSLIAYNAQNDTQVSRYVNQLNEWLQEYTNASHPGAAHRVPCQFSPLSVSSTQACAVNTEGFGPCSSEQHYGYKMRKPCIFIKMNRIYGWKPDYFASSQEAPDMPDDLKAYIDSLSSEKRKQVWISCKGEGPADNEALRYNASVSESISYYPSRGIPSYYYPYTNQAGYINPIIAVQFKNIELGRIVNIRCRAWAKNIIYSPSLKVLSGSTHIEILIDNDPDPLT